MEICLMVEGQDDVSWEQWLELARTAEANGLAGLFRSDHYLGIRRHGKVGGLDAWATLAGLAASTNRLRIGTLVSPVTFRSASVLAKNVVTVDHISRGRVELGIGAGWYEPEHLLYGFPFPPLPERLDELGRQLIAINGQWSSDEECWPKPWQQPRPPVIIGGLAKKRTVQLAVAHADEYNTYQPTVEEARARRIVLDEAATRAGRAPLRFSIMLSCVLGSNRSDLARRLAAHEEIALESDVPPLAGTVSEVTTRLLEYAAVGVQRVMLQQFRHEDLEMVELMGELARAVA